MNTSAVFFVGLILDIMYNLILFKLVETFLMTVNLCINTTAK